MKLYRHKPLPKVRAIKFEAPWDLDQIKEFAPVHVYVDGIFVGNRRIVQGDWIAVDEDGQVTIYTNDESFFEFFEEA